MMIRHDWGLLFNPFEHLDSTRDKNLFKYLVIPKAVEIAWEDAPIAILSQPGAGKSALRLYTEMVYGGTRGVKLAVTYIPDTFDLSPEFHFLALRGALARAVANYIISYPDVFLQFTQKKQNEVKAILAHLPFDLDFFLEIAQHSISLSELEDSLGVRSISGIDRIGKAHVEAFKILHHLRADKVEHNLTDLFAQVCDIFAIKSVHILMDGADGFIETTNNQALVEWMAPLLDIAEHWGKQHIFIKFFLPLDLSYYLTSFSRAGVQAATLVWDDSLLAEVIRRRLYVASGGGFDSLDALSTPDLRNVELRLAQQIPATHKTPRRIIRKTVDLLARASQNADGCIHAQDMEEEEKIYAARH